MAQQSAGKLTALSAQKAKPASKPYRMFDGGGLYLEVMPSPSRARYWRLKYRYGGKEKRLALGVFPEVTLTEARERRDQARKQLREGTDPGAARRAAVSAARDAVANSFKAIASEWLTKQSKELKPTTLEKVTASLNAWVFPWLGQRPIAEITTREFHDAVLRRIVLAGKIETAQRVKQRCSQVFQYAIVTGRSEQNPAAGLRGVIPSVKSRSHSAITEPARVGELLRAIDGYNGYFVTSCALRLAPYLFVRPGELRRAEWSEIDLDGGQWSIPAEKMKMEAPHIVPLAQQAISILRDLKPLTGADRYVFPGLHNRARPMSENAINLALRRLGYAGSEMVGHGFRSMASTLLNEQGWPPDVIERQLAHSERNEVRRAYNRAKHLPDRKKMMQQWADYLDGLKAGVRIGMPGAFAERA
jgi:integrase